MSAPRPEIRGLFVLHCGYMPGMYIILAAVLGACFGSFINVVVLRLPKGESLGGRSRCPACHSEIRWYQNIPLMSFIWLRGRCAACHAGISWQYPLVEGAGAALFAMAYIKYGAAGDWLTAFTFAVFGCFALAMFATDAKFGVLPDHLTVSGAVAVGVLNLFRDVSWAGLAISALGAAGFFWFQRLVSRGRWVGEGDVRLGAWLGLGLGWPGVLTALLLAYVAGALAGLGLIASSRATWQSQIPFGTFLTAAAVVAFVWGDELAQMYVRFIGGI